MEELWKSYGSWIIAVLLGVGMVWMHTRGHGGCGMGHQHSDGKEPETVKKDGKTPSGSACH